MDKLEKYKIVLLKDTLQILKYEKLYDADF